MDKGDSSISVYTLITNLCEKFSNNQHVVQKSRSKLFEVLLGKREASCDDKFLRRLSTSKTSWSVMSWQYYLASTFGLVEHSNDLKECAELVEAYYGEPILRFLMCFCNKPKVNNEFEDFDFCLEKSLKPSATESFRPSTYLDLVVDSPESIWEFVLDVPSNCPNWEHFSYIEADKEKSFLSELGHQSSLWIKNLPTKSHYHADLKPHFRTVKDFAKDIKYLLVGVASYSFEYNARNQFKLIPGILVEGLTLDNLQHFTSDFIQCGDCYKALYLISSLNPTLSEYKQQGYIFTELCKSIARYLEFYCSIVMNIPESIGLLGIWDHTRHLRAQLKTVASICKVGPYLESEKIPHGVSLLNYLYQTTLNLTDKNMLLVLCSILFPCCQVYFSQFLKSWLLDGTINDPYSEFFIKANLKYTSSKGRTFWTRSYSIREDIVPDFLSDLQHDILACGKSMNLLKQCVHSSKLCLYLMGKKPHIISCCLTSEQLQLLEENVNSYYQEISSADDIKLETILNMNPQQDPSFVDLISQKRAVTLKRITLEKKKALEEAWQKKQNTFISLRKQYDLVSLKKEVELSRDIKSDIKLIETDLKTENARNILLEEETKNLVSYYSDLCDIADNRKREIEGDHSGLPEIAVHSIAEENRDPGLSKEQLTLGDERPKIHSSKSLDVINANSAELSDHSVKAYLETCNVARKIREKVLREELNIITRVESEDRTTETAKTICNRPMTDAQRNKWHMLTSEWGMNLKLLPEEIEVNRNTRPNTNQDYGSFIKETNDNDNFVNKNNEEQIVTKIESETLKPQINLDFNKINEKPIPMSLDSTPLSDLPLTPASKMFSSIELVDCEVVPTTTSTEMGDGEEFRFDDIALFDRRILQRRNLGDSNQKPIFSKKITQSEASKLNTNNLKLFLHESISTTVAIQSKLVNTELLKYFICDLEYFKHLSNLRDYFFLQDGEFGRNITENLFEKLYDVHFPTELINCRTLRKLVFEALHNSSKVQEDSDYLSFKINFLPKQFQLRDPHVLDCLSLTYKVKWPLNILLPADTVAKYDEVFKFLIKLSRISWVLKRVFLELRMAKETGRKEIYLLTSPHYRRLHQCRHVMLHFIQTLQNYIVGEVLQTSWDLFQRNLAAVTNLDLLYLAHAKYIHEVLFLCLLSQKSAPLRKIIEKIFIVILKFYDYLRSRSWTCDDGVYAHPNFTKLESIFMNFEEFVVYLFKVGRKVAKSGYQPHLQQLLNMLDVNGYYSSKLANNA